MNYSISKIIPYVRRYVSLEFMTCWTAKECLYQEGLIYGRRER